MRLLNRIHGIQITSRQKRAFILILLLSLSQLHGGVGTYGSMGALQDRFLALRDRFWPCEIDFWPCEIVFGLARRHIVLLEFPRFFLLNFELWPHQILRSSDVSQSPSYATYLVVQSTLSVTNSGTYTCCNQIVPRGYVEVFFYMKRTPTYLARLVSRTLG